MNFPISGIHIPPAQLMGIGFIVGTLGGFFGVGGSFLAGPAMFSFGMPMNFVVGTDLCQVVGTSIVAAQRHRTLGHVDFKLGLFMVVGTISGVEVGAQTIQRLKRLGDVDKVVAIGFIIVLVSLTLIMAWESWKTLRMQQTGRKKKLDTSALGFIAQRIQRIYLPPMISLPNSGIEAVSMWVILSVAFVGGAFSGFLGGGAGFIRMPSMVFLLGVPTHMAVGTDLFEIIISASYGTLSHAMKGNVDVLVAYTLMTGHKF